MDERQQRLETAMGSLLQKLSEKFDCFASNGSSTLANPEPNWPVAAQHLRAGEGISGLVPHILYVPAEPAVQPKSGASERTHRVDAKKALLIREGKHFHGIRCGSAAVGWRLRQSPDCSN